MEIIAWWGTICSKWKLENEKKLDISGRRFFVKSFSSTGSKGKVHYWNHTFLSWSTMFPHLSSPMYVIAICSAFHHFSSAMIWVWCHIIQRLSTYIDFNHEQNAHRPLLFVLIAFTESIPKAIRNCIWWTQGGPLLFPACANGRDWWLFPWLSPSTNLS